MHPANSDQRLKADGKPKYLLSGLRQCSVCEAHYIITNATSYACSGYHDGRACSNSILVRRDRVENILLGPIRDDLLEPDRVARLAKEMQVYFSERMQATQARATKAPRELEELDARITQLRDLQGRVSANLPAKAIAFMSKAAEIYRRQVAQGLDGNPQAALKVRVFLREWLGGKIWLEPLPDGGLQAHWMQNVGALCKGLGIYGTGGTV